jgi:hypothetical protein
MHIVLDPNVKDLYCRRRWDPEQYEAGMERLNEVVGLEYPIYSSFHPNQDFHSLMITTDPQNLQALTKCRQLLQPYDQQCPPLVAMVVLFFSTLFSRSNRKTRLAALPVTNSSSTWILDQSPRTM